MCICKTVHYCCDYIKKQLDSIIKGIVNSGAVKIQILSVHVCVMQARKVPVNGMKGLLPRLQAFNLLFHFCNKLL